ncbi:hypothetical protein OSB04_019754, partial [Centaurea solstitialis]
MKAKESTRSYTRPVDIYCDNSGAVAQAKEPREHHKSRHVLRKFHLIREIIGRGDVRICKIPTDENVADPLIKPLARVKHETHANSIGMQYLDTIFYSAVHVCFCLQFPTKPSKDKDQNKWCDFHEDHGHTTDECISFKKEISYLKSKGHLKGVILEEQGRPASPVHTKVVNCITGGSEVCGLTYSAAKRHARDGPDERRIPDEVKSKIEKELDAMTITFDKDDTQGVHHKHHDAPVIQMTIGNCSTKRIMIDGGSSANVIFADTLKVMGIERSEIVRRSTTLIGFNGDPMNTFGEIILPVFAKGINKQTKFNVVDCQSTYNVILRNESSSLNSQDGKKSNDDLRLEEVVLDPEHPDRKVFVGASLPPDIKNSIISFLEEQSDSFAWSHEDMVGIDPNIISHKLNVDPTFKPINQKRRKFAPEGNKVINDEVDNLLKTGKIREVKYPDWLANVVIVQKKTGKWRVCIDFTDLNKACPKDPFPLPHIDAMVDATAGHELLTFMDAYSGYNQILMHTDDQEKTAFMTDKGIYCYKVMPFDLKNAGSTYQRLVNMMFKEHLGRTMEVYIDDMLVKSERSIEHVAHLKQSFDILRQYKIKLNPTKCSFGVRAGKFLGYLVTQRGIEASPEQVKAITEIQSPRNVKEVQRLTGRVAALTRFISRSSDKCHLFYNVLRKNQGFLWTDEHEKALQELKQYMTSSPLLTKPVEGESLQLYLAVSKNVTSAVLVREEDQQQRPIYYVSKSFLDAETRYTSMEKLLLVLMTAAKKLRHYFESHHIIVVTNYPLKTVLRKPELTGRLAKWSIYLSGFDIEFKPKTEIKSQALADFVAEFSPGLEPTTCDEVVTIQETNLVYSIRCEFKATNNEAEYEALIAGLDIDHKLGAKHLDSKSQVDTLANLGSAFNDPTMENIPILHLTTPTIEAKDEVQMDEEIYNWSLDVWNYLKHDKLPEDKLEARKTRSKASRYIIFEDQLYRRSTSGLLLRCVVSQAQMNQILQEMHDGECGNHAGGRSLANRISRQGYYWPTLREDAIRYVQRCDACQKHSSMIHRPSEPLHSVLIPWPFMRWGMDIMGKLPPAPGQKVYLLVLTDYFSKWIEAGAFSYPQSDGLAESSNKVIINSIRKRLKAAKGKWVEELPSVLWANRTTPRTSTGQTPYSLVYGCEAVLPVETRVPIARNRTIEQNVINLSYDLDALEELREKALRTMAAQKGIVERHFNKKVKAKIFQVGDYVLRHVFQNTQESNAGKLSIKWEGPYIISKIIGNGAYRLTTIEGMEIPRSWNAHHLKRIMENNFQPTLQQQLAAAQQQIQQLANQNMEANNEIVRLRGLNPQVTQTNPAISAPLPRPPPVQQNQFRTPQIPSMPQASQIPVMPQVSQNNVRPPQNNQSQTIFPPLPSGPPPAFTYIQPQGVPRPFYSIPEPIPHIPTINTTVTHIPIRPNYQGNIGVTPTENLMDVRLKMLEEQNKAMLALLAKLPGAAVPVEVEPKTGFQASPYVDEIALMEIPKKYNIPAFTTKYSGITDPVEHVAQYKQLMWTASIPSQYQEACMCKSFGSTLTGAALQWLINLKPKSIESFAELVNQFTRQFASSRKMEKQTSDLYYVVQKTGETIRDYFNRFNAEMIEVKNCDIKTAIEAYKRGVDNSSELYTDLTKYPPENFDDVRARTLAHMRIEDDAIFRRKHSNEKKNLGAQKHDFKPKRVNKIGNSRQESKTRMSKDRCKRTMAQETGEPSKDKDQTKWCEFHADHGHTTDECISLKKEIAYLKTNGHLKGIIGDEVKRPASPIHTKVVNCITGGSEVCGLTYSAAKRHAREGPEGYPIPEDSKTAAEKELDAAKLTFDQDDLTGINQKHHDALVIQLTIGNCLTKRVLVDGGSSANVIFSDTLKIMGIDRSNIVRRTTTLVGFNGDATSTLGEIVLPVFAKGINKQTKFNVIDCPSAYNAILGRPWIHDMKAIPSTYHQKIKFPSPWGVQEIDSEKKIAHCFAWSHEDMVGIDPDIISHKLNVDPSFKPIKQKRRKFAPERNKVINDEVDNLLKTGKIREVKYPDWLANVVVVQKKNGKWRVCIDFTDLNRACPKDPFPLPHIDAMVDATAGHELLTFMDAYSGYNQILMHTDDQEKTAFMTDKGIYCYKVMPFGLKNAGSTYQRLVNMMFKEHLGRTMEVYIDDMLVKSERSHDHIDHLKQSFDILRQYKMKLNPTKCSFGVRAGKFLGYMVTQRGIKASPADQGHQRDTIPKKRERKAHEKALQDLKQYMASPPLLTKPIEGESLQLYLAVSNNAVSAVLVREDDQQQHPIYYISKSFLNAETRYTSMEKLLLGLVTAAKKLRHYFESHHIIVVTNYPLKTVLRKPELTGRLAKWSIYLSGFDLTYKPRTAIKSQALADFVAEFSPEVEQPSHDEINNVMIQDNQPWTLYVDGSSNIRGSGLGIVLKSSHGGNMVYSIRCEFKATNNEAEYEALIAGLEIAYNSRARRLHVRSDSLLVVNQINGDFQAKDSKMMVYLEIAKESIARFEKFSIEQIPRDLNVQADALANLGSAFNEPTLENIPIIHLTMSSIEAKEKVQMIEEVYNWSLDIWNYLKYDRLPDDKMEARKTKVKASRYTIFEGRLYRKSTSGLILRCITSQKHMNQILQEMHDGECGNHSGGRSLANRISRQGYYWPTLREDAMRYVQKCDACQKHSGMSHLPSEPLHSVLIPWPFMRWGMDIVGKLPPAPGQKVYLLVLTDYFSKWIEAAAFSQVRDKEVISFIQTNIIYRFGVPSEIMCDNGSQFISERTRKFCDERGIRLITSTPRYPQSNGLAESSNKVIINSIRKRLKEAKGRWVEELPSVLWANRTTPRTSTGQTPFSLVYGCEAVLPIESQLPIARHRTMDQNVINLYYDLDALEELREKAFQKMASQKAMVERHFNKKVKAKIFQVGDYVLRQVFQNTQELNAGKLSIKWEGPYIISKIIGNGAYKLTTIEGKEIPRSWNAIHLK